MISTAAAMAAMTQGSAPDPVCMWCGKTYEGHLDAILPSGAVPRMPCLGLKKNFAAQKFDATGRSTFTMRQIQAPKFVNNKLATIFLAGSIEMGVAEKWQDRAAMLLSQIHYTILNPRRSDWDSSWKQEIQNEQFYEQVTWELQGLEDAEWVLMYFDPNTKSPITLLELGLIAGLHPQKLIVICPEGFYRKGNVDIVCDRYRIKTARSLEEGAYMICNQHE